ncbi:MAG: hypothetical protein NTW04_02900 [Elusimicrobia bacterium]|nr:hypothetical protein [Elusimicrobiota bacterium]
MSKKVFVALFVLFAIYLAITLTYNLAYFPGLHVDEAWEGLNALSINKRGATSPHGMNGYTSALHSALTAQVFKFLRPDVFSLRIMGVVLNIAAALMLVWHLAKKLGIQSGAALMYLIISSALFMLKSRVAWEVYAMQNFLLAVIFILAGRFADEEKSLWAVFLFLLANMAGIINHFIFLSVPSSLLAGLIFYRALSDDNRLAGLLPIALFNFTIAVLIYFIKPRITPEFWQNHKFFISAAFLAAPFIFALTHKLSENKILALLQKIKFARLKKPLAFLFSAGICAFVLFHWVALLEIWSGVAVLKRLASLKFPLAIEILLYMWATGLLLFIFIFAREKLRPSEIKKLTPYQALIIIWPLTYMAAFSIFTNTSSIRYYIIPSFMLMVLGSFALAPLLKKNIALYPLIIFTVFLNCVFWREIYSMPERKPLRFIVGRNSETSAHFLPLKNMQKMRGATADSFTKLPMEFYSATEE